MDGASAPSRGLEYLFYQSLIGIVPPGWDGAAGKEELAARLSAYLSKASREAKQETSWLNPNSEYEAAIGRFVGRTLDDRTFVEEARGFCELVATYGACNGLAQLVLKLCAPGVPDTYQGSELWNQTLVDPDNRRNVDFSQRRRYLAEVRSKLGDRAALSRSSSEATKMVASSSTSRTSCSPRGATNRTSFCRVTTWRSKRVRTPSPLAAGSASRC